MLYIAHLGLLLYSKIKGQTELLKMTANCRCKLKRILPESELIILKDGLSVFGKKFSQKSVIAELKNPCNCPHAFSYGFNNYCCNQEKIIKLINR